MSFRSFRLCRAAAVVCVVIGLTGCGGLYDSSVTGVVTLDGQVVPRGTVSYQPEAGGPPAYARIASDGGYVLHTGREQGLRAGEYFVTITANEPPTVTQSSNGGPPPPGKAITPVWYRSRETSGLKKTVESGSNEINLELTSQPPAGWNPGQQR